MSKPSRLIVVFALFAFGIACGSYFYNPAVAQDKPKEKAAVPAVTNWEYRVVVSNDRDVDKELNKLGEEGFEVAFVTASHRSQSNGARAGAVAEATPVVFYTLKRAKK